MTTQNSNNHTATFTRRGIVIASLLAMPFLNGDETVELDPFIVGATRTERAADTLGVSADSLVGSEIEKRMYRDLRHALFNVSGVYAPSDEALASTSEVMIRGNSGSRVLSIVDGAKTNSSIFSAGRFMAGASGFNLDSVEVIRGAQSTLYGSSAIGGVILLETRRGSGAPSYAVTMEAGSFNSYLAALQGQGESGDLDFSFHLAGQESDNERLDNEGKMKSYSFRFDYDVSENTTVGIVSRGEFSDYSNPSGDLTPPPSARIQSDAAVMSAYVETVKNEWTQKLSLSLLDEYYRQTGSLYIGDASNVSLDWQNVIDVSESMRLVAGSTWEAQEGNDNSFPESEGENWALFAQAEVAASESVNFVVGARYDDYEYAGSKSTLRANGSWMLPSKTKLRAAVGSAFRAPNFFRLFSTSLFALGNPSLKPEESESWEIGFDQYFSDGNGQFGLTYFCNDIENLVTWIPTTGWDGTYVNRDVAENYGVEAYADFQLTNIWSASVAYTWTESESTNLEFGSTTRQPGVPRHQISLVNDLWIDEKWSTGVGINYILGRESFGSTGIDDYVLVRLYGRYRMSDSLSLTGRLENAFDEDYTFIYSSFSGRVPARGLAAFGGLEWRF
jgi:vitamin B12 transporter